MNQRALLALAGHDGRAESPPLSIDARSRREFALGLAVAVAGVAILGEDRLHVLAPTVASAAGSNPADRNTTAMDAIELRMRFPETLNEQKDPS